jgi:superfamily II DNA or RNA helicase
MIQGVLGPIIKVASTKELIDKKQLSPINIKCVILNHPKETKNLLKGNKEYDVELNYLVSCEKRNKFIRNLVLSLDGNTLVLYRLVEKHGDVLDKMFNEKVGERRYFYVHGNTDVDEREEVRSIVEKSNNAIILASYGVFGAGINIKRIHNIVFASPSKSLVRVLQAIGRGLRVASDKSELLLFDIADDLSNNNKKKNFSYKHLVERLNIYTNEEFPYTLTTIDI